MHLHFIGIGGIGMSGLAAAFRDMGYKITGSDRGAGNPENSHIINPLKNIGIEIFPRVVIFIDVDAYESLDFISLPSASRA